MAEFGIFCENITMVCEKPAQTRNSEKGILSAISDEALYGGTCRVLKELGEWSYILSFYGYAGYVKTKALIFQNEEGIREYLERPLGMICGRQVDVLSQPAVQGVCLSTLGGGALVEVLAGGCDKEGWTAVRLLDGRNGYIPTRFVDKKRFGEEYLWKNPQEVLTGLQMASKRSREAMGGNKDFSLKNVLDRYYGGKEDAFRDRLIREAFTYLGTQYRWGGRAAEGIDCSGLVSMAYMRSGVLIYRDAAIADGYAMERIPVIFETDQQEDGIARQQGDEDGEEQNRRNAAKRFSLENLSNGLLKKGDALYFPGHIAMYVGEGRYIHSTARSGSNGVVINSLCPGDPDYREDLLQSLYAVGGVRLT